MKQTRIEAHEVLGIAANASRAAVRRRYRELAKRYHPDINDGDPTAEWVFKQIQTAYAEMQKEKPDARAKTPSEQTRQANQRNGNQPPWGQWETAAKDLERRTLRDNWTAGTVVIAIFIAIWAGQRNAAALISIAIVVGITTRKIADRIQS